MKLHYISINKRSEKKKLQELKRFSNVGKLRTELDKVFRQILLIKRPHRCEWCKKHTQIYVSHIMPKGRYPRLRYVELNVLLLCYYCHMVRWHKNPLEVNQFIENKSKGLLTELKILHKTMPKHNIGYLQLLKLALLQELNSLKL